MNIHHSGTCKYCVKQIVHLVCLYTECPAEIQPSVQAGTLRFYAPHLKSITGPCHCLEFSCVLSYAEKILVICKGRVTEFIKI